jgi:hypothetical protein
MKKQTLFRELFFNYIIIVVAAIVLTAVYATFSFRGFYFSGIALDLEERARLIEPQVSALLISGENDMDSIMRKTEVLCEDLGERQFSLDGYPAFGKSGWRFG